MSGQYTCETPCCLGEAEFCGACLQRARSGKWEDHDKELIFKINENFDLLDRIIENLRKRVKALRAKA